MSRALASPGDEPGHELVPEITDYNYIGSAIGNAFFSGVTFEQLWSCVNMAKTPAQLDEAVSATIKLNEMAGVDTKS